MPDAEAGPETEAAPQPASKTAQEHPQAAPPAAEGQTEGTVRGLGPARPRVSAANPTALGSGTLLRIVSGAFPVRATHDAPIAPTHPQKNAPGPHGINSSSGSASGGNSDSDTPEGAQPAQPAPEQAAPEGEQRERPALEDEKPAAAEAPSADRDGAGADGGEAGGDAKKLPRPVGVAVCPRCESTDTKFCYYNNYNVKQPRYFCKVSSRPLYPLFWAPCVGRARTGLPAVGDEAHSGSWGQLPIPLTRCQRPLHVCPCSGELGLKTRQPRGSGGKGRSACNSRVPGLL